MNGTGLAEVPGMCGVVDGGIVAGVWGYEAGQSGVGDIFSWFTRNGMPGELAEQARRRGVSLPQLLDEQAPAQPSGAPGLIALDGGTARWAGSTGRSTGPTRRAPTSTTSCTPSTCGCTTTSGAARTRSCTGCGPSATARWKAARDEHRGFGGFGDRGAAGGRLRAARRAGPQRPGRLDVGQRVGSRSGFGGACGDQPHRRLLPRPEP